MASGGLSAARLDRLRRGLDGYVERGEVPGLVALVSRRGEVHVHAAGAKAVGGEPVARDTIFRIASMTKAIVAVAALILLEETRLRLDDPVDGLLPELADRQVLKDPDGPLEETVPAERALTVRDLLTFRAGYAMVTRREAPIARAMAALALGQGMPGAGDVPGPDEWIRRLGTLPLLHQPGERWMYHTGSDILGVLIARAAGQPLEEFLRERIFDPLGMKDTRFHVPADQLHRFTTSYLPGRRGLKVHDQPHGGRWSAPPAFPSGGGGLASTVDDYHTFARMLLDGGRHGGTRILSRPAVEVMTTDHLTPAQKAVSGFWPGQFDGIGWGFGVSVVTRRTDIAYAPGQYGWTGGLGTSWRSDPHEDMVTILATPVAFASAALPQVHRDFETLAYQAIDD